jgi:hypothetical protein
VAPILRSSELVAGPGAFTIVALATAVAEGIDSAAGVPLAILELLDMMPVPVVEVADELYR